MVKKSQITLLIRTMLRIGCIGFGGGSALIPVIEDETVRKRKLLSMEEYDKSVIAASITPGALPVEVASGVGYSVAGGKGMVASAVSMALPGAIFTVLLLMLFSVLDQQVLERLRFVSVIISAFIIYLLMQYIGKTVWMNYQKNKGFQAVVVILMVFLLNGGKEIASLLGSERKPVFDISSIQVMGLAFFVIFFLAEDRRRHRILLAVCIGILFLLCNGKAHIIDNKICGSLVEISMLILGAYGFLVSLKAGEVRLKVDRKKIAGSLLIWLGFLGILILPACFFCQDAVPFIMKGLLSAYSSFGGGDAYLSVAEGMFVNSGMIESSVFYGQLVAVANLLPGSILCKILSGTGYLIGYGTAKMAAEGVLMALAGFGVSVFGSCSIFMICWHLYSELEHVKAFQMMGSYIRPVVSGLLINIALSLLMEILAIGGKSGISDMRMIIYVFLLLGGFMMFRSIRIRGKRA